MKDRLNSLYGQLILFAVLVLVLAVSLPILIMGLFRGVLTEERLQAISGPYIIHLVSRMEEGALPLENMPKRAPGLNMRVEAFAHKNLHLTQDQKRQMKDGSQAVIFRDNKPDGIFTMVAPCGGDLLLITVDGRGLRNLVNLLTTVYCLQVLAGGVVIALITARRIVRPIIVLNNAARRVTAGDFSIRLPYRKAATELTSLTDSFNTMVDKLGKVEMLRSGFISDVSHEFKIPLTTISGYAHLLQGDCSREEAEEYKATIMEESIRLTKLVDNILTLNRLERKTVKLEYDTISVAEQVRRALTLYEPTWSEKGIFVRFELEEVALVGYESLLMQVWTNLIDNAIKFTPEGGIIVISLTSDEEETGIIFSIRDSGPGIAAAQAAHIFDKFYQADNSRGTEGNGLGLAIVNRIVQIHRGDISVESKPGEGSVFTVRAKSLLPDFQG